MPHERQTSSYTVDRRKYLKATGAAASIGLAGCLGGGGGTDQVNVAHVLPLSGPYEFVGNLANLGGKMAAKNINDNGGIESLGGAEINVIEKDAGDSVDSATTAAQEIADRDDITMAMGCWLSTFTLGATNVAARSNLPWMTLSFSDEVVERGLDNVFKTTLKITEFSRLNLTIGQRLANEVGEEFKEVALLGDNSAAVKLFLGSMADKWIPQTEGVELVVNERWTPPLSDATSVVRKLKDKDPDMIFWNFSQVQDAVSIREKMKELDVQIPVFSNGGEVANPSFLKNLGPDLAKNILVSGPTNILKGMGEMNQNWVEFTRDEGDEMPYLTQEPLQYISHYYILKEVLENTGSTDSQDVIDELRNINITSGQAVDTLPMDSISFDDTGQLENAGYAVGQWQAVEDEDYVGANFEQIPFTVLPSKYAIRDPIWPGSN